MRCDSGSLFLECLQLKVSVCVRRLSYSRWKASAVRTGSMLERSSKISFDKWRLYHALDRSSGEKNTWMEKREDFLAIAVLKRGQGKKRSTHFFSLTLSQKLPVLFSAQTHTRTVNTTFTSSMPQRERVCDSTSHILILTQACLYETPKWNCPLLMKFKL